MRLIDSILTWHWADNTLAIQTTAGIMRLSPLAEDLMRLRVEAPGGHVSLPSGAIAKHDWAPVPIEVSETEGRIRLSTARISVVIEPTPVRLNWFEGERLFARDEAIEVSPDRILLRREMPADEHYYGFGQKTGYLDKRGRKMQMWATDDPVHTPTTDPLYQSIPFFVGLRNGRAHGLFLDSPARSIFDMGSLDPATTYTVEVFGSVLDSYVFAGPGIPGIISRYTELTGRMALPPSWSLGFHQCRWSYYPESKLRELAHTFRDRKIPCDALWLDIDFMDGYRVFTWDRERFPQPEQLIADLAEQGFRVVTIVDPGVKIDPQYAVYREGVAEGHFIQNPGGTIHEGQVWPGASAFPDFMKEETRRWWGDLHKDAYLAKGVAGIWNDMNEPASFISNSHGERTLPHDVLQGEEGHQIPHREVHNAYGFRMAQATFEGLRRRQPEKRPFILTRSGYAGIQRYAAAWMGDNHSWWEHMLQHMTICSGMGLSGVPFAGADVGGFGANPNGELVARWIQLGAFTPFFRMHTSVGTRDQEPWSFGPEVEAICRRYINLRYRLLPFFYSLFEEASRTGLPIMRPLVLEHQDDPETRHISDQVLLGRNVLVAPVYQPGATRRLVYLPEGTWYDFWTGARHEGRQHVIANAALETLPLYVRGGTALPMGPEMPYVGAVPAEVLTLHIFPGQGEFDLYEDEGEGYGYRDGVFARTRILVRGNRVEVGTPTGGYVPPRRKVELLLYGVTGPITVDGAPVETTPESGRAVRLLVGKTGSFVVESRSSTD